MAKTHEGFVNFIGDNKSGGGKGCFVQGQDGWLKIKKDVDLDGFVKGAKVKVSLTKRNGETYITRAKVIAPPGKGGSKGGRGGRGGGFQKDPAVQRSIVMQHSQDIAVTLLKVMIDNGAIKLGAANKPDARKAALLELLDDLTAMLYTQAAEDGPARFIEAHDGDESDEDDSSDDDWDEDEEDEEADDSDSGDEDDWD